MSPVIILHYHEIALKGRNRDMFEQQLVENVRWALRDVRGVAVRRISGRIVVRCSVSPPPAGRGGEGGWVATEVVPRLQQVFGVASILVGNEVRQEYAALEDDVVRVAREVVARTHPGSFVVRVKRGNKEYPKRSIDLEREIGAAIVHALGLRVDLTKPDLTVHVEIVERTAFVFTEKFPGPGGLPVGVSGRVLCLISSGFDSPVAAWKMMRRGCVVDFVHFHSYPYTSDASLRNVEEIVRVLQPWQQERGALTSVPLIEYQKAVMTDAPAALRILLYRRMMFRIAERIARHRNAGALITGESVGQVASQTIPNIAAVESVVDLPVLRPLIGEDKQDIIVHAERIGTAVISTRPYDDCCSLFTPAHPATSSSSAQLTEAESPLGVDHWVEEIVSSVLH